MTPPGARILVAEDEPSIADNISYALETEGFVPHVVGTGGEALAALAEGGFTAVILDVGLPDGSGFDICREIRSASQIPVLFLTARSSEIDRVVGLEIGGDDYVVKPFSPRELTARLKAVLRRSAMPAGPAGAAIAAASSGAPGASPPAPAGKPCRAPGFAIDDDRMVIWFRGEALALSKLEFRLLKALLSHPGRVFSRDQLMERAWDEPESAADRTVDAHVKMLRAKLRQIDAAAEPIRTHRGVGYSMWEYD
ncbi:MAG: two-component system response regulator CreB [Verrucomicrobiales bacterium]